MKRSSRPKRKLQLEPSHLKEKNPPPPLSFGNYPFYYNKRKMNRMDTRLFLFKKEWFQDKIVWDIGCNAGFVTLLIAQLFSPREIIGIDIDPQLIRKAKRNCSLASARCFQQDLDYFPWSCMETMHFSKVSKVNVKSLEEIKTSEAVENVKSQEVLENVTSLEAVQEIEAAKSVNEIEAMNDVKVENDLQNLTDKRIESIKFPNNVGFRVGNWLKEPMGPIQAHVILALSITKWIHLNHGDKGLMDFFKKVHDSLLPSGIFLLEPQSWDSYEKRISTPLMRKHYESIQMKPTDFVNVLLELGFSHYQVLEEPKENKRFQRCLYAFFK